MFLKNQKKAKSLLLLVACTFLTLSSYAQPTDGIKNIRKYINTEFINDNATNQKTEAFKAFLANNSNNLATISASIQDGVNHDFDAKLKDLTGDEIKHWLCLLVPIIPAALVLTYYPPEPTPKSMISALAFGAFISYNKWQLSNIFHSQEAISTMKRSWNEFLAQQKTNQ